MTWVAKTMEVDAKLRECTASQTQHHFLLSDQNCLKDEFPFETSSKVVGCYNLLDIEHHQVHVNGSSLNTVFGVQTATCYDLFDAFPYGSSSTNNNDVDFSSYECKPFAAENNNNNLGYSQVMNNFQISSQRNSFDDLMGGGSENNMPPFDFQQIVKPESLIVHDELSCVTNAENGYCKKVDINNNRLLGSTRKNWRCRKKSNVVKGQWTVEEDRLLIQLVEQFGLKKWCIVAQMLPGRIGKQCRERWHNHLRPNIKKDTWSEEEDKVLIQAHIEVGNKWAEIAKSLPGRTENSIKNHWNATKRRQLSKRRSRSKHSRKFSILQEYIKSLNLEDQSGSNSRSLNGNIATADIDDNNVSSSTTKQNLGFGPTTDRLLPEYDFNQVVQDLCFDEKLIQESCSIDSLLGEISNESNQHGGDYDDDDDDDDAKKIRFQINNKPLHMDSVEGMGIEVKMEMDLVEMMSQQPAG